MLPSFESALTITRSVISDRLPTPPLTSTSTISNARRNPALLVSEEAQDLILSFACTDYDLRHSQSPAWAFALVHRAWLDSGRRALYRHPLVRTETCWGIGLRLLKTLHTCPHLALHVRSLAELAEWMITFNQEAQTNKLHCFKWQVQLIKLCFNATDVAVGMGTKEEAVRTARVLSALDRLHSLNVISTQHCKLSRVIWNEFLLHYNGFQARKPAQHSLDHLRVAGLEWGSQTADETEEDAWGPWGKRLSLQARKFTNGDSNLRLIDLKYLISTKSPRLLDFSIETNARHFSSSALSKIVNKLPTTLQRLKIECDFDEETPLSIAEYPPTFPPYNTLPNPPDNIFTSFPSLTYLALRGFRALSLSKVALLSTSPNLLEVYFDGSTWDFAELDVAAFVSTFRSTFPRLERTHLGTLPVPWENEDAQILVGDFEDRGVHCDFDECEDEEDEFEFDCEFCEDEGCYECDPYSYDGSEFGGCGPFCDGSCGRGEF
ncbi:hypothetical protein P7C70_g6218, partial [Phenoliferia sp. Uapishka_3]